MKSRIIRWQQEPKQSGVRVFRYPLDPSPKLTVICDGIKVPSGCAHVSEGAFRNTPKLRSETLAAPASLLLDLGAGWMPKFPLVAFTGSKHGFLDAAGREQLWQRFAVPVFEQLIDDEGRIFAWECEAHSGLHIDTPLRHNIAQGEVLLNGSATGIAAREISGLCGCGRIGPRLLEVGPACRLPGDSGIKA
jgi:hypothetical protein